MVDKKNLNKYSFQLLKEEAETVDLFEDNTHENVANTIETLITEVTSEGLTIGLEGSWGSGKSTVISILKKKINQRKDFLYFYFDAWAHEGDPLRRVFLESIIDQLAGDDNELIDLKNRIANRKKRITTTTKHSASTLGKILSIAAFLIPLGVAFITRVDVSTLTCTWTGQPNFFFIFGVLFALSPILTTIGNLIYLLIKKKKICDKDNWIFLQGEKIEDTKQEISEDEERSSIEFERYFKKIIDRIFQRDQGKRLLMVIDNLDRVDPDDSLKIWSTLQTFLQQRNPSNLNFQWYKKIWIIVPYDQSGLSQLWKNNSTTNEEGKIKDGCAKAFFDKCFQIRLEVPKPILSGWENFAQLKIEECFSNWNKNEKEDALNVLKLTRRGLSDIPTPREIKTYINQIGILRINSNTEISTQSIAYYVFCKYLQSLTNAEIAEGILKGVLPFIEHFLTTKDIVMHLAGLLFGVSPQKGQELLIEPEIQEALIKGDGEKIAQLCKTNNKGFWIVFDYHIRKTDDVKILLTYSRSVLNGLWDNNKEQCANFIEKLKTHIKEIGNLGFPTQTQITDYEAAFQLLDDHRYNLADTWKVILNNLVILIQKIRSGEFKRELNYVEFTSSITKLASKITSTEIKPFVIEGLQAEIWIAILKGFITQKIDGSKLVIPGQDVVNEIAKTIIQSQPIPEGTSDLIRYSIENGIRNWIEAIKLMKIHIEVNNGTPVNDIFSIQHFEIIELIALNDEKSTDELKSIIQGGAFHNLACYLNDKGAIKYSAVLTAIFFADKIHTDFISIIPKTQSAQGVQEIRNFWITNNPDNAQFVWETIQKNKIFSFIWILVKDTKNILSANLIQIAIDKGESTFFPNKNILISFKDTISIFNDQNKDKIIASAFLKNSTIENEIVSTDNLDVEKYSYELFLIVQLTENKELIDHITLKISQLKKEAWDRAFNTSNFLFSLSFQIKKKNNNFELQNDFYQSITEFINKWINNEIIPTDTYKTVWTNFIKLLGNSFQTGLEEKLTNKIIEKNFIVAKEILELNKNYIDFNNIITEKKTILQNITEEALNGDGNFDQLYTIDFIISNSKKTKFIPDKYKSDIIKEPINNLLAKIEDKEKKELLTRIAGYYNVKVILQQKNEEIK